MQLAVAPEVARTASREARYVCTCLRITEHELLSTLSGANIRTLQDLRRTIGAGDGCTACHPALQRYLDASAQPSCPPICSAR
jgi:bacterioferritin-associated ferredoxin